VRPDRLSLRGLKFVVLGVLIVAAPVTAGAAVDSCAYDPATRTVTATITTGSSATLKVDASGQLLFGQVPAACGDATSTNTDSVSVTGSTGSNETLTLDMSEAFFGPGFTSEFNIPEIELATALGDLTDTLVVIGSNANDLIAAGQNGMAIDADGDLDVTLSPGQHRIEVHGLDGDDLLNMRGQGGAGLAYLGPVVVYGEAGNDELVASHSADFVYGGEGNDTIYLNQQNDHAEGGPGNDFITGGEGNDDIVGGPGADTFNAGAGNDTLHADDGEADTQLHGGPDVDTAYYDANLDPATIAVENKFADPGPPPPPPPPGGACSYNSTTKSVTAAIPAGEGATLAVVGGAIHFGASPTACGTATTANTDTITIAGATGSVESLTIDQTGGGLAPGGTAETTGTSEIELGVNLGDASDLVVVKGRALADTLAVGTKGVSFNNDADVDVTFTPLPSSIELLGGGGGDVLSGRGGFGAGQVFPGRVTLRAGDGGDSLSGGDLDDILVGGAGTDMITGGLGNDQLDGQGGADSLSGNDGNDTIVGGAGTDSLIGAGGNDTLDARDGAADTQISGAAGVDIARYDAALDPLPVGVEVHFPE
jgi:Ca2+-binding RTX toxin-like protein